jgi:hypothetical protein
VPSKHARISPSSLPYLALCPGRLQAIEALPPQDRDRDTQASIDGTRRHALSEWRKNHPLDPWPTEVEGYKVTSDDIAAVSKIQQYFLTHDAHPARGLDVQMFLTEEQVEIGRWCGLDEGIMWGTADTIMATRDMLEIADDKYGQVQVDPDNWQNKAYAVGAGVKLVDPATGEFFPHWRQVRNVKLTIVQPTAEDPIKSVVYPLTDLETWARQIGDIARKALAPGAKRVPGDKQCRWCAAAGVCRERMESTAKEMFNMVEQPDTPGMPEPIASVDSIIDIAETRMTQDPESMTPEEIGRMLDTAIAVEGWFQDLRKQAQTFLQDGTPIPGWKLIAGKRSRAWKEGEDETAKALKSLGVKIDDLYSRKLVTPAQAEKCEVGRKHKVILGADKARMRKLEDLWSWKEGKPALAPESDPAPAVNDAHSMFEAPPQEPEPQLTPDWI